MACMWFGEISSCSCLTALPGPALVLLSKIGKPFAGSLYIKPTFYNPLIRAAANRQAVHAHPAGPGPGGRRSQPAPHPRRQSAAAAAAAALWLRPGHPAAGRVPLHAAQADGGRGGRRQGSRGRFRWHCIAEVAVAEAGFFRLVRANSQCLFLYGNSDKICTGKAAEFKKYFYFDRLSYVTCN